MTTQMTSLCDIITKATAEIPKKYFEFSVSGAKNTIYRERVYCYELYHQMRRLWPTQETLFLCAEVDKAGHPVFNGSSLSRRKPDFLVHVPGTMDNNYAAIEVKPVHAHLKRIYGDIEALKNFRHVDTSKNRWC